MIDKKEIIDLLLSNKEIIEKVAHNVVKNWRSKYKSPHEYDVTNINLRGLYIDEHTLKVCASHIDQFENVKLYSCKLGTVEYKPIKIYNFEFNSTNLTDEETNYILDITSLQQMIDVIYENFIGNRLVFKLENKTFPTNWIYVYVYKNQETKKFWTSNIKEVEFHII